MKRLPPPEPPSAPAPLVSIWSGASSRCTVGARAPCRVLTKRRPPMRIGLQLRPGSLGSGASIPAASQVRSEVSLVTQAADQPASKSDNFGQMTCPSPEVRETDARAPRPSGMLVQSPGGPLVLIGSLISRGGTEGSSERARREVPQRPWIHADGRRVHQESTATPPHFRRPPHTSRHPHLPPYTHHDVLPPARTQAA